MIQEKRLKGKVTRSPRMIRKVKGLLMTMNPNPEHQKLVQIIPLTRRRRTDKITIQLTYLNILRRPTR